MLRIVLKTFQLSMKLIEKGIILNYFNYFTYVILNLQHVCPTCHCNRNQIVY